MEKIYTSFGWARHGLYTVWKEEINFRREVFAGFLVIAASFYFNFSRVEWIIAIACITIVLIGEVVNTVVEDLCNKIEPHHDPMIGKVKDMAAGFMLLSLIGTSLMGLLLFGPHILALF